MHYQVLSKYECHDKQLYLALVEGEACHSMWGASSHVGEVKYVQFISQS